MLNAFSPARRAVPLRLAIAATALGWTALACGPTVGDRAASTTGEAPGADDAGLRGFDPVDAGLDSRSPYDAGLDPQSPSDAGFDDGGAIIAEIDAGVSDSDPRDAGAIDDGADAGSGPAPAECQTSASSCSIDVYNRAVAFAAAHPTRSNGGTWNQYCGALMVEFGGFGDAAPTAISAYDNSTIVSKDPTTAPIGAFHYWSLGSAGHVGVDLMGEGAVVFMASDHLGDSWNPYIGVNSVDGYSAMSGGTYLGWSTEYNGHGQVLAGGGACGAAAVPSGCAIPATPTATTGVPDQAFVMRLQEFAAEHGYTGALDGKSAASTWKGVQAGLGTYGYTGPVNGLPGPNTYEAFQRLAAKHGYTGPVNGVLGPNTFRGFAAFLNSAF